MPIKRSSDQRSKTLVEFYQELTHNDNTIIEKEVGEAMLAFIEMVNQTFNETTLYGLTSLYRLVIQQTENYNADWLVIVYGIGQGKWKFEYKMSGHVAPWRNAVVVGEADSIEEAKDYLIIAMVESGGWKDNEELAALYKKLKGFVHTKNP